MAATYAPEQLGIKAPSGGFQTGGWYSGRQYWNGTLSDPGVIHPQSNQQGAGGAAYVAPKDQAFIQAEQAKSPTSQAEVTPYLNNLQNHMFQSTQAPEVKVPTMDELKKE